MNTVLICSVKPIAEDKPLVIPLIGGSKWKNPKRPDDLESETSVRNKDESLSLDFKTSGDSVTDSAVSELLQGQSTVRVRILVHNDRVELSLLFTRLLSLHV